MADTLKTIHSEISSLPNYNVYGRVTGIVGMMLEIAGVEQYLSIGDRCLIAGKRGPFENKRIPVEVVGFRDGRALAMPFASLEGLGMGSRAEVVNSEPVIYPDISWLGRVINAMGEPIDGKGPLEKGLIPYPIRGTPPPAHKRRRVGEKLDLGVRALNTFLTCCKGQRMGIFSASGVGKSTLMSMIARFTESDVSVIGLVGERGREVQEFLQDDLGDEGLARSVVVVATSDESPLLRRQAAYVTLSVSEYFRDVGREVLCMIDSITRFAMAQREIGLSVGEPPASKGYTPTVFAELPKLLERAGPGMSQANTPGKTQGDITGLFTVLVEGDDMNEPVSDAVRGILDGHIVLDRSIAERGRYPAINILRSVSRTLPDCNNEEENALLTRARQLMATYNDMAEMIRLGAYRPGSDAATDESIFYHPLLEEFLQQRSDEPSDFNTGYQQLENILHALPTDAAPNTDPEAGEE